MHFGEDSSYQAYKDFEKEYIGSSDLPVERGKSYIVNGDCEIGEHYRFEAEFYTWLNIYDDDELVKEFKADIIRVYRAGNHGCIIQLLNR